MDILDNISSICGLGEKGFDFYFSCAGGKGIVFEGNLKIEDYSNNEIVVRLSSGKKIFVSGLNLKISSLAPKEIGISGQILNIGIGGRNEAGV